MLVIGLAAFFIFGPERLPTLARDAARGLGRAREAIAATREKLQDELGDDFAELRELDLRSYHPRTYIRDQLFAGERPSAPPNGDAARATAAGLRPSTPSTESPATRSVADRTLPPPFDFDAT